MIKNKQKPEDHIFAHRKKKEQGKYRKNILSLFPKIYLE